MEFNATFFATIISFSVFVYLMNKILYEPICKIVTERENFIDGNYSDAEKNQNEAAELNSEREEKLDEAKEDARAKYNELLSDYKGERADIIQNAQNEASENLEQAYAELDNVSNETKESLKGSMKDLANDIVEKVIGYRSEVQDFDNDTINEILYH